MTKEQKLTNKFILHWDKYMWWVGRDIYKDCLMASFREWQIGLGFLRITKIK